MATFITIDIENFTHVKKIYANLDKNPRFTSESDKKEVTYGKRSPTTLWLFFYLF
jgi:hypothetical protein